MVSTHFATRFFSLRVSEQGTRNEVQNPAKHVTGKWCSHIFANDPIIFNNFIAQFFSIVAHIKESCQKLNSKNKIVIKSPAAIFG